MVENEAVSEVEASARAIRHYCPICAAVMYKGYLEGEDGLQWICPEPDCGFYEPV